MRKEINAHGVTVVRIRLMGDEWEVVQDDPHNRRFTGATQMAIASPLEASPALITPYSPVSNRARGTLNNCGNGYTPWGTYLTCEENWPGYFTDSGTLTTDQERIDLSTEGTRYGWDTVAGDETEIDNEFARFDVTPTGADASSDYRNEANGHGYITEIDPYNPLSMATKRTAMGRFRLESCVFGKQVEGQPVVFYSGHDERFEYIYKFVSSANWDPSDVSPVGGLATGSNLAVQRSAEANWRLLISLTLSGVSLTAILEFIIHYKSFPIFVELMIPPVAFFALFALRTKNGESLPAQALGLFNFVLILIVAAMLVFSVAGAFFSIGVFFSDENVSYLIIPIALAIMGLPYVAFVYMYVNYENALSRLLLFIHDEDLVKYARNAAIT